MLMQIIMCITLGTAAGLQCFTCNNARSMFFCAFIGKLQNCKENQKACETVVRRSGTSYKISKGCKQVEACFANAKRQVDTSEFGYAECNTDQDNSVCTCCCQEEWCNLDSRPCSGMQFPCDRIPSISNGNVTCTNGDDVGSSCTYQCPSGFFVTPVENKKLTCKASGKWTKLPPCCARPCPPYLMNDIMFVRQASGSTSWIQFQRRTIALFGQFTIQNNSTRAGVLSYGNKIHNDSTIDLKAFSNDKDGLLNKLRNLPFTDDSGDVRTGKALSYVLTQYFTSEKGHRPGVRKVIILQADNTSTDDVVGPAQELQKNNITTYAIASTSNKDPMFLEQLRDIVTDERRLFFEENPEDVAYLEDLTRQLCSDLCSQSPTSNT